VSSAPLDDFLLRHAPGPRVAIAPVVFEARAALASATESLRPTPDQALEHPWRWRGGEADVRYGFYRILELLEAAALDVAHALGEASARTGLARAPSGDLAALATAARWDLHGRLASLDEEVLDRDPGGGEWTVRRTLGHIVNGQRAYGWYTAWWLQQRISDPAALPKRVPDDLGAELPDEEREGDGSLAEIRERLEATLDGSSEVFAGLGPSELALNARWSGIPVTIGFRIGRWSSHLREHTLQVDKTLAAVGWQPREVDRLLGLLHGAYGRLESLVFTVTSELLEEPGADGRDAAVIVSDALTTAEGHAQEVAAAAATAPGP
jgi:hypothetical protein